MNRALLPLGVLLLGLLPPVAAAEQVSPASVVRGFLTDVRSGRDPDAVGRYFADRVRAHQLTAEGVTVVTRTPDEYAAHVREFLDLFGSFELTVEEVLADGPKVFVRWKQVGHHLASLNGEPPSGQPLVEITSVVYRVEGGRIVEYWLQTDRKGLELQLSSGSPASQAAP